MRMKSRRTLAILLSMILLLALAPSGFAVNLAEHANKITVSLVKAGDDSFTQDVATAHVQADLYLLAAAKASETDDSYSYVIPTEESNPFRAVLLDLQDILDGKTEQGQQGEQQSEPLTIDGIAQRFARIVLDSGVSYEPVNQPVVADNVSSITVEGLDAGLYLLVLHGSAPLEKSKDPVKGYLKETEKSSSDQNGKPQKNLATRAFSADYEYLFEPQLLTVPAKYDENGVQQFNTAYGNWSNELTVTFKPTQKPRNGDLKIIKNIKNAGPDPVTFVFEVTWPWPAETNDTTTKVVSMTFDRGQDYEEYVLSDTIPIGTGVLVTEIYSGIAHTAEVTSRTATIVATTNATGGTESIDSANSARIAEVEFTNDHSGPGGGYGLLNRFTADDTGDFKWGQFSDSPAAANPTAVSEG